MSGTGPPPGLPLNCGPCHASPRVWVQHRHGPARPCAIVLYHVWAGPKKPCFGPSCRTPGCMLIFTPTWIYEYMYQLASFLSPHKHDMVVTMTLLGGHTCMNAVQYPITCYDDNGNKGMEMMFMSTNCELDSWHYKTTPRSTKFVFSIRVHLA
jgi:hypothetical protein